MIQTRRYSAPQIDRVSMISAIQSNVGPAPSLETAIVFPEYLPSSSYDTVKLSNWSHFRPLRRFWEYLVFAIGIILPIQISYVMVFQGSISPNYYSVFFAFDIINLLDNLVELKTPFLRNGLLQNGVKDIIINYGIANFTIHALASIPIAWIGVFKRKTRLYMYLSINRLFRLHKCYKSNRFIQDSQAYQGIVPKTVPYFMFFILAVHLFACALYLIAHINGIHKSWLEPFVSQGYSLTQLYVVCLYFCLTTIFTIGFGDIHPITTAERVLCIFLEITGVLFQGFILARMVTLIQDPNRSAIINSAETLINYLKQKKIDKVYRMHVAHYNQNVWNTTHGAPPWNVLFHGIPTSIKSRITLEFFDDMFSSMPLFRGMRQNFFIKLVGAMEAFTFIPGEIVYQEGECCFDLFFFHSGIIQLVKNGQPYVTQETNKNYIDGEKEFLFQQPREQSLVALTFVDGWRTSREHFCQILNTETRLKKLLFINVRHLYPDIVEQLQLNEDNMWAPVDNQSNGTFNLEKEIFGNDDLQIYASESSDSI
ncbi:hypothetical protein M9Y10_021111 [Tritrichomonas musculus]|uniref:Cyclic nucleotide-binding domain-containing protein n=1 Tax=Tritrichomonas musculus TaxID=1915356 RepID=A0ABR2HE29_9EUKA